LNQHCALGHDLERSILRAQLSNPFADQQIGSELSVAATQKYDPESELCHEDAERHAV